MKRSFLLIGLIVLIGCSPPTRAPVRDYGTSAGFGSAGAHNVVEGDTLWFISQRYQIAMQDIVYANNLRPPYALNVGGRLRLPPPRTYKVRAGDNLYAVARLFNVSPSALARQNNLRAPYRLFAGKTLKLPPPQRRVKPPPRAPEPPRTYAQTPTPGQKPVQAAQAHTGKHAAKPPKKPVTKRTPARSSSGFLKPAEGRVISSYGAKKGGLHNDGINIRAPRGTAVKAAENGVVVYAGSELKGSGNLILIRHRDRWMTAYAHLDRIKIKRGQTIKRGDIIGTVGSTGSVDTPQLHFELRRGTEAINPERYIKVRS